MPTGKRDDSISIAPPESAKPEGKTETNPNADKAKEWNDGFFNRHKDALAQKHAELFGALWTNNKSKATYSPMEGQGEDEEVGASLANAEKSPGQLGEGEWTVKFSKIGADEQKGKGETMTCRVDKEGNITIVNKPGWLNDKPEMREQQYRCVLNKMALTNNGVVTLNYPNLKFDEKGICTSTLAAKDVMEMLNAAEKEGVEVKFKKGKEGEPSSIERWLKNQPEGVKQELEQKLTSLKQNREAKEGIKSEGNIEIGPKEPKKGTSSVDIRPSGPK